MSPGDEAPSDHAATMDRTYRWMKHVYDATRPFFLAGRAAMRREAENRAPGLVVEMGSGTARNLILPARRLPRTCFVGIEISPQMLRYAERRVAAAGLAERIGLIAADAAAPPSLPQADVVLFSYSLSMMRDWRTALRAGAQGVRPGGAVLVAEFAAMKGWPRWAADRVARNLAAFQVRRCADLEGFVATDAAFAGWSVTRRSFSGGYAALLVLSRP